MLVAYGLVLGIVQGVTEFLPISSSGHLVLLHQLWPVIGDTLRFDIMLHAGSLVALLIYFRAQLWGILRSMVGRGDGASRRLLWQLVVATLPVVIATLFGLNRIEDTVRQAWVVAGTLALGAGVLAYADRRSRSRGQGGEAYALSWSQVLLIGIAQVLALVPGLSRSGMVIAAGLLVGLRRDEAANFAFLMAIPAVVGAVVFGLSDFSAAEALPGGALAAGFLASALASYLAMAWLLRWLRTKSLQPFVWYRLALAALVLFIVW